MASAHLSSTVIADNRFLALPYYTNLNLNVCKHASRFFVIPRRRPAGLLGGKSRDFNDGMAEKMPQDCIGLG